MHAFINTTVWSHCAVIKVDVHCENVGYDVERGFIILQDCAVHCWNSSSSVLSALLFLILMTSKLLEGAFTNLLSIVFSTWIVSNCFLECCVQWAQHSCRREGEKALILGLIFRAQTWYIQYFDEGCLLLARSLHSFFAKAFPMKLIWNVSREAWLTCACLIEKQMVARSGFSLFRRRRNQLLTG